MTLRINRADWNPNAICQVFTADGEPVPMSTPISEMSAMGRCYFFSATMDILLVGVGNVGTYEGWPTVDGDSLVFEVSE